MSSPPDSRGPSWTTRAERPGDAAAVRRVNLAAFGTPDEADLVDALREDPDAWLPHLSHLALAGEDAVGTALLTRCRIGGSPALALAPCAVLPEHQGRGAGSAAVRSVLDAARAAGERAVVVLGHPAYYPRFGFTPCSGFGIVPPPGQEWPDDAFLALSLDGGELPRGTVHYAPAFGL
ncbi:GNAT family N-acetyltransferase [Streptomyces sp. WMMB 714]|uniref:GNAT family N-acetyltransferase n=1 Tax=Streptomyces sp. WMMB 714 TaxID=1286822 RepID=UPI0005F7ACEC|nr:N-acetyltransferase [Streptomyces sp. WMMB 714]